MIPRTSLLAIPTVLLASGCGLLVEHPAEPPSAATQNWDEMPLPRPTYAPSTDEISARWVLPEANQWAAYQKLTLLASLDATGKEMDLPNVQELDEVIDAQEAGQVVARVGLPDDVMWVVDLRGAASVAFGASLSAASARPVAPIMTFNNWPAENELVPAEETLSALVTMLPKLPETDDPGMPVFLLDAWRLAYRHETPEDDVTDNRYMLTFADLPDPGALHSRGIDRVIYVVKDLATAQLEEDDLHQIFLVYQREGIVITIVDLKWLIGLEGPARWRERLRERTLEIDPDRATVVNDADFYVRAQSGFGGAHVFEGCHHPYGYGVGGYGGYGGGHAMGGHGGG